MLPYPADQFHDEEVALDWWENDFAQFCESLGGLLDGAALARTLVGSIRAIRREALDAHLTLAQAARETGYSARQISRWIKDGRIVNYGGESSPRVRRGDVVSHKKVSLHPRPPVRIMGTAQDIARSVANSKSRYGDG